jgi:hypothetical protein
MEKSLGSNQKTLSLLKAQLSELNRTFFQFKRIKEALYIKNLKFAVSQSRINTVKDALETLRNIRDGNQRKVTIKQFNEIKKQNKNPSSFFPFGDDIYEPINTSIADVPVKIGTKSFFNVAEVIELDLTKLPKKQKEDVEIIEKKISNPVKQQMRKLIKKHGTYKINFVFNCIMSRDGDYEKDENGKLTDKHKEYLCEFHSGSVNAETQQKIEDFKNNPPNRTGDALLESLKNKTVCPPVVLSIFARDV